MADVLANYSVVLGSWRCKMCSHISSYNFIWLTVAMALAGVVLVVFLLLVKMTVSSVWVPALHMQKPPGTLTLTLTENSH